MIRKTSLQKLQEWFASYLDDNEQLRLFVDVKGFLFQGVEVLGEKTSENSIFFPFFRDGLQWIEFQEGLTHAELEKLIEFLNRFRMLKEEDEDDLVTAMWSAEFQFIKYKTANEFWEIDPITEIASFKVGYSQNLKNTPDDDTIKNMTAGQKSQENYATGPKGIGALFSWIGKGSYGGVGSSGFFPPESKLIPPRTGLDSGSGGNGQECGELGGSFTWEINEDEKAVLDEMLSEEARRSQLTVGVDLAMALLVEHSDPQGRAQVLKFIGEVVLFAFARGEYLEVYTLIRKLEILIRAVAPQLDQLRNEFQKILSTLTVLEGLFHYEGEITQDNVDELVYLNKVLGYLTSDCAKILTEVAAKIRDDILRGQVLEAIARRAFVGGQDLAFHVNSVLPPKDIITIIKILGASDISKSLPFILGLSRHVKPEVREEAAVTLLVNNTGYISNMPHLLAEPDPKLARQIFWLLGRERNATVERLLINFIRNTLELNINRPTDSLLLTYRTLGLSASTEGAVDFCAQILLKKDLRALFGLTGEFEQAHRVGAALALLVMGPELGQGEVLHKASRSLFLSLKRAYQKANLAAEEYRSMTRRSQVSRR
jgi:hypothetical protein